MKKLIFFVSLIISLLFFMQIIMATLEDGTSNSPRDEWWMLGGNITFDRFSYANTPLNLSNASVITKVLDGTTLTRSMIIVGESLYINPTATGSRIFWLNASNISQQFQNSSTSQSQSVGSPTYYNGTLYVHVGTNLVTINASNVSQVFTTASINDNDGGYYSNPVILNGSIFVGDGNNGPKFREFNLSNASQALRSFSAQNRIYESSPYANGYFYMADAGVLRQLNASNISQQINTFTCAANAIEYMFPANNQYVYKTCTVGSINMLFQLNASNISRQIANYSNGSYAPALGNGFLYASTANHLFQLNASNVSQLISTYIATSSASITAYPLVTSRYVYAPFGNQLVQLNASNVSQMLSNYTAASTIQAGVVAAKGFLYFGAGTSLYQLGNYNPLNLNDTSAPSVTLNSPSASYSNNTVVNYNAGFDCSATDDSSIVNISLYLTNNQNASFSLNQTSSTSGNSVSGIWNVTLGNGNYTWNCLATDENNYYGFASSNRSIVINSTDRDGDGSADLLDRLIGNSSSVTHSGFSILNVTVNGTLANGTFSGLNEVAFYDSSDIIVNFSFNFSSSIFDLNNVTLVKNDNYLILNFSGQVPAIYNKTAYIDDNNFESLCLKDQEISSISEVGSSCNGSNETDITSCIGSSSTVTFGSVTCRDLGDTIRIGNLRNSAVLGVPDSGDSLTEEEETQEQGRATYINEIYNEKKSLLLRFVSNSGVRLVKNIYDDKETGLREFEIRTKDWITGEIEIKKYDHLPDRCKIEKEDYLVYRALDFEHNFDNEYIDETRVRVEVKKEWIEKNKIKEIEVVRCYPEYQELMASYVSEDSEFGIYDVYSKGFSIFAIIGTLEEKEFELSPSRGIPRWISFLIPFLILVMLIIYLIMKFISRRGIKEDWHFKNRWFDFEFKFKIRTPPHKRKFLRDY